ncbi:MAG: hypothetical protein JWQ95_587 [Sphaerisporangium sp.]|nr:hypothetical protein [Sphaerisporangium sp.]
MTIGWTIPEGNEENRMDMRSVRKEDGVGDAAGPVEFPDESSLRRWLAGALAEACDGEISATEILGADCSFVALGVGSLSMVRLIDAIETGLDVEIEFDGDAGFLEDMDSLVSHLTTAAPAGPPL